MRKARVLRVIFVSSFALTCTWTLTAYAQQGPEQSGAQKADPGLPSASTPPPAQDPKSPYQGQGQSGAQKADASPSSVSTPVSTPPPARDPKSPYQGKGFLVSSSEGGKYSLAISGRLQLGIASFFAGNGVTRSYTNIDQARLIFSGNVLSPDIYYAVQLGYGAVLSPETGVPTPLIDTWVDFRQIREANLKVGTIDHHAQLYSSVSNQFTRDSLAWSEFGILRDVGVQLHADELFGTDRLKYWLDVNAGEGLNYVPDSKIGFLYYGRIEVSPFGAFDSNRLGDLTRRNSPALALAVQAAYNQNALYQLSNWYPAGMALYQVPFDYIHGGANLNFKWRGFSLFGAALYRRATELSHTVSGTNLTEYSRNGWGWWTMAGMMLTSHLEIASRVGAIYQIARSAGLVATAPYLPVGAVQLDVANFRDLREVAGGVSYYFAGHAFKLQSDYARIFVGNFREGVHEARLLLTVQL